MRGTGTAAGAHPVSGPAVARPSSSGRLSRGSQPAAASGHRLYFPPVRALAPPSQGHIVLWVPRVRGPPVVPQAETPWCGRRPEDRRFRATKTLWLLNLKTTGGGASPPATVSESKSRAGLGPCGRIRNSEPGMLQLEQGPCAGEKELENGDQT